RKAGVHRFVQISAINVDEPLPEDTDPVWRAYVEAKRDADAALRESGLDWTIVRPGRLTDDEGTGRVALGPDVPRGDVPRADVAAVVARIVDTGAGIGAQWNLVGGDTPGRGRRPRLSRPRATPAAEAVEAPTPADRWLVEARPEPPAELGAPPVRSANGGAKPFVHSRIGCRRCVSEGLPSVESSPRDRTE
ncbi:MAG: SDR family oxidoreductase, partial [Aeromicrobium erythreum]